MKSPARESDPALRLRTPPCIRHTRGERPLGRHLPPRDEFGVRACGGGPTVVITLRVINPELTRTASF